MTLVASDDSRWKAPVFGTTTSIVTDALQLAMPMTPNTRHSIHWVREWSAGHGRRARGEIRYGGFEADVDLALGASTLAFNEGRYEPDLFTKPELETPELPLDGSYSGFDGRGVAKVTPQAVESGAGARGREAPGQRANTAFPTRAS